MVFMPPRKRKQDDDTGDGVMANELLLASPPQPIAGDAACTPPALAVRPYDTAEGLKNWLRQLPVEKKKDIRKEIGQLARSGNTMPTVNVLIKHVGEYQAVDAATKRLRLTQSYLKAVMVKSLSNGKASQQKVYGWLSSMLGDGEGMDDEE